MIATYVSPPYISPFHRDYHSYTAHLRAFNRKLQSNIRKLLQPLIGSDLADGATLYTTGSDGRLEKGPVSPLEFILLVNPQKTVDVLSILTKLQEFKGGFTEDSVEVKALGTDSMNRYNNDHTLTYPQRILDLSYILGTSELGYAAVIQLVDEWRGKTGKNNFRTLLKKERDFKSISNSGLQILGENRGKQHYDVNEGISFYNPEKRLWSFKLGPLRYVQFALVRDLMKIYRQKGDLSVL